MSKSNLKMVGNFGCYLDDDNVISFQIGDRPMASVLEPDPMFPLSGGSLRIRSGRASRDSRCAAVASTT